MTKPNIYILPIKRKGKKGERVTLHQRLYYNGTQWQTALGISIPAEHYNAETEIVTGGINADIYNRTILTSKQTLRDILLRYELVEHKTPTIKDISHEYIQAMTQAGLIKGKTHKPEERVVYIQDHLSEFIKEQSREKQWTIGTCKKFRTLAKHLDNYTQQITFEDLTEDFLYGLLQYWSSLEFDNTTIHKYVKLLKWYLRWCARKAYYSGTLYDTFRPKLKGSEFENKNIIYLTQDELQTLEDFTPGNGQAHLARVRDRFLFACYCGLRFSDVSKLKPQDIHDGNINVITEKTHDAISIPLNKHTRAILDKYKDVAEKTGRCFPAITNQRTNEYLHDLCRECGIDAPTSQFKYKGDRLIETVLPKYELITFHASRRTFITHAARLGIPAEVIMKFSGHHSLEMLKPYLQIVDELKKKEMAKFDLM